MEPITEAKQSTIFSLLAELRTKNSSLANQINTLAEHLKPILSPAKPTENKNPDRKTESCEVTEQLAGIIDMTEAHQGAIENIRNRLEI